MTPWGTPNDPHFWRFFRFFRQMKKNAEKNMFFEKSIFNDFLDAKKVAPRSHNHH